MKAENFMDVPNKFEIFRKEGKFIDCILEVDSKIDLPCHRIVISKFSNYFRQFFLKQEIHETVFHFQIPFNPKNLFPKVIDFFYQSTLKICVGNAVSFYALAKFYEIPQLELFCIDCGFRPALQNNSKINAYRFCMDFTEFPDLKVPSIIVDHFATHYYNYSRDQLLESTTVELVYQLFTNSNLHIQDPRRLPNGNIITRNEEILAFLDAFHACHPITDSTIQNKLAALIDHWETRYASEFSLKWTPSSIIRPLLRQIVHLRRESTRNFVKTAAAIMKPTSRWWALTHAKEISTIDKIPLEISAFARTLGGTLQNPLDPEIFGMVYLASSPVPDEKLFNAKNAIDGKLETYFTGMPNDRGFPPFLEIRLGEEAHFKIDQIFIQFATEVNMQKKLHKLALTPETINPNDAEFIIPGPKVIKVQIGPEEMTVLCQPYSPSAPICVPGAHGLEVMPGERIRIIIVPPNKCGGSLLRIANINVTGEFLP